MRKWAGENETIREMRRNLQESEPHLPATPRSPQVPEIPGGSFSLRRPSLPSSFRASPWRSRRLTPRKTWKGARLQSSLSASQVRAALPVQSASVTHTQPNPIPVPGVGRSGRHQHESAQCACAPPASPRLATVTLKERIIITLPPTSPARARARFPPSDAASLPR